MRLRNSFRFEIALGVGIGLCAGCSGRSTPQAGTAVGIEQTAPKTPVTNVPPDPKAAAHERATDFAKKAMEFDYRVMPARSIVFWKKAIAEEPDNREWQESLAFVYWKAKDLKEAIPLWTRLAKGNDEIATRCARMVKIYKAP